MQTVLFRGGIAVRATIEDTRKRLQDFLAPDLGVLKEGQLQLRGDLKDLHTEMLATELRTIKSIEAAKAEILLTIKVNTMSELTRENEKL